MNLHYRNPFDQVMTFELGGKEYRVLPGATVEIPEKYDYAISEMGLGLETDYDLTFTLDQKAHPENWQLKEKEVETDDGYVSRSKRSKKGK